MTLNNTAPVAVEVASPTPKPRLPSPWVYLVIQRDWRGEVLLDWISFVREVPRDILERVEDAESRLVASKDKPDKVFCYAVREPDGQENLYESVFYPGAEAAFREEGSFVKGPYRHDVVI